MNSNLLSTDQVIVIPMKTTLRFGMEIMKILQNQIRCNKCGDEPYSAHRHDFKYCKCGAVAVDGGMEYLRRVGNPDEYTDLSYSMPKDIVNEIVEATKEMRDTGRNDLGIALGVMRVLRKHDLLKVD
jgi:ribosomal protein L37E